MCNASATITTTTSLPSLFGVVGGGIDEYSYNNTTTNEIKQCTRQRTRQRRLLLSSTTGHSPFSYRRHYSRNRPCHQHHHHRRRPRRRRLSHGITTLMYAAQQGFVQSVETIIKTQSHSLFDQDRTGKTALHYCCTSNSLYAAQVADLIKMAAPELTDTRDEDGFTPLHLAVIAGNTQLVTFLLANGADVAAVDNEKHTVVHWATVCSETTALRAVLAAGAPVSTPDVHGGYPLHYAAQMCGGTKESEKGLQILHTLLTHKDINVACEDNEQRQPLLWAASAGSAKAVLALIKAGSVIQSADRDGLTALHCAASRGHTDCIDTLLTLCGASPDIIDSNGCTALHYAVTLGHADATALLLAHGADPNRQDRKGRSPAHCGCAKGQFETVKLIAARNANLWLRNARGDLPLHEAAASGRRELISWLLNMRPSQVNAKNSDGRTSMHMAALNDNVDMCKILLDCGASINPVLRTSKNVFMTPLDCALQKGHRSTAKYLQVHGGVPASKIGNQSTARSNSSNGSSTQVNVLQIKEDVTFWNDDTSSTPTSDREHHHNRKTERKSSKKIHHRKKSSSKTKSQKKKTMKSEERELESDDSDIPVPTRKINAGTNTSALNRRSSNHKIDYNNEITLINNGKTEINIHHSKAISVETDASCQLSPNKIRINSNERITVPTTTSDNQIIEKSQKKISKNELVPESIVPLRSQVVPNESELTDKKNDEVLMKVPNVELEAEEVPKQSEQKINANEAVPMMVPEVVPQVRLGTEEVVLKKSEQKDVDMVPSATEVLTNPSAPAMKLGQSTGTSDDTLDTVIDTYKQQQQLEPQIMDNRLDYLERSGTSEEYDEPQKIVVEASVHPEPLSAKLIAPDVERENKQADGGTEVLKNYETIEVEQIPNVEENKVVEGKTKEELKTMDTSQTKSAETQNEETTNTESSTGIVQDQSKDTVSTMTAALMKASEDVTKTLITNLQVQSASENREDSKNNGEIIEDKQVTKEAEENGTSAKQKVEEATKNESMQKENAAATKDSAKPKPSDHSEENKVPETKGRRHTSKDKNKIVSKAQLKQKSSNQATNKQLLSEDSNSSDDYLSDSISTSNQQHRSFKVLSEKEAEELKVKNNKLKHLKGKKPKLDKQKRSKSEETTTKQKPIKKSDQKQKKNLKSSRIPAPIFRTTLSKSERQLDRLTADGEQLKVQRIPSSLPNIHEKFLKDRPESNLSVPILPSMYYHSDNENRIDTEEGASDSGPNSKQQRTTKKVKKRSKFRRRESKSADGSDYESSSNLIDSGFEPSPKSSRIPKWKNLSNRGVNMTSVTRSIQNNIRRYHLERKIFQHLLDLKRNQIRAGQHNESVLVKRAIDQYNQSCSSTVGAGRYTKDDYTFKSFEKFLYESLRKLQKIDMEYLKGLPTRSEHVNPLLCTQSTHRCMHATHAYTGVPCAAYLPKMDHHSIPKIGFGNTTTTTLCKPGTAGTPAVTLLPDINQSKKSSSAVTLELSHGVDKQIISLPTDRLDQNKRYYVTFTVKGQQDRGSSDENNNNNNNNNDGGHVHAKSD